MSEPTPQQDDAAAEPTPKSTRSSQPSDRGEETGFVKRAQAGDLAAYDELIRRYQERIYGTLYHMTSNHEDAHDLAQESFIQAFAVKGASENLDSFESGVSQIARGLDGVEGAVKKVTNGPFVDYLDAMGNIVLTTAASGESLDAWNKRLLESDGVIEKSGAGLDKFGERIKQSKLIVDKATGAVIGYQGSFEGLTEAEKEAAGGAAQVLDTTSKIIPVYDKVTGKITGYKQNLAYVETGSKGVAKESKNASNSISKLGEDSTKAANAVKSLNERFQEMQHAERLKAIESQTAITTAQINADAQTMTAAFESVASALVAPFPDAGFAHHHPVLHPRTGQAFEFDFFNAELGVAVEIMGYRADDEIWKDVLKFHVHAETRVGIVWVPRKWISGTLSDVNHYAALKALAFAEGQLNVDALVAVSYDWEAGADGDWRLLYAL